MSVNGPVTPAICKYVCWGAYIRRVTLCGLGDKQITTVTGKDFGLPIVGFYRRDLNSRRVDLLLLDDDGNASLRGFNLQPPGSPEQTAAEAVAYNHQLMHDKLLAEHVGLQLLESDYLYETLSDLHLHEDPTLRLNHRRTSDPAQLQYLLQENVLTPLSQLAMIQAGVTGYLSRHEIPRQLKEENPVRFSLLEGALTAFLEQHHEALRELHQRLVAGITPQEADELDMFLDEEDGLNLSLPTAVVTYTH